ncbi:AMIN-like domain-containing (lipo)protein [Streptomyces sp. NPDC004788]
MRKATLVSLTWAAALALTLLGTTSAVAAAPTCADICILDIRTATHDTYDRLVIDLGEGTIPGWTTGEQTTPLYWGEEGSQTQVPIKGDSYLKVSLMPAETFDGNYQPTYTSPRSESYAYPSLKGQAFVYSFEDSNTFGLALGPHSSYKVFKLTAPNRIVIDINH